MEPRRANLLLLAFFVFVIEACCFPFAANGLLSPSLRNVSKTRSLSHLRPTKQPFRTSHAATPTAQSCCDRRGFSSLRSSAVSYRDDAAKDPLRLNNLQSKLVKTMMVTYILSMCVALPVTLFPVYLLHRTKLINRVQKEKMSLKVGQFCSRWLMRVFPFARKRVVVDEYDENMVNPQPCIWVCNHISLLDLFFVLALDKRMRGKNRRPIKILYVSSIWNLRCAETLSFADLCGSVLTLNDQYLTQQWKGLESNPITRLLCKMCGFIPVDMADNGNGTANEYDPKSFKLMLKSTKSAIEEGFDIGLLPEGQPNPTPERGLQPVYPGAFTLAKMSKRPIQMIALYGLHRMWHPDETIGMVCTHRDMAVRVYPKGRVYGSAEEFTATFEAVVGEFGAHGKDLPEEELNMWLDGSVWQTELKRRESVRLDSEDVELIPRNESWTTEERKEVS